MKRSLKTTVSLLCLAALIPTLVSVGFRANAALKGDVDGNGVVNTDDVRAVMRMAAEVTEATAAQKKLADYNGDGSVTTADARAVLVAVLDADSPANYKQQLISKGFPVSYTDALYELHKKYPEWEFVPFVTNLDWNASIAGERTPHKQQLIETEVASQFKCDCSNCNGVIQERPCWVSASKTAVERYMDPRNWLDEKHIFQFENIRYSAEQTVQGVEAIIRNTWMSNAYITYKDASGKDVTYLENGAKVKYSSAILNAAADSGLSAYYIASKIVQEVGSTSSSVAGGSCGTFSPYKGIYNYYNIGANTGAADGLAWANGYMKSSVAAGLYKSASTSSERLVSVPVSTSLYYAGESGIFYKVNATINSKQYTGYIAKTCVNVSDTYNRPWDNPQKSIYYGAKYIASSFGEYQYTGYLQKFNVNPASSSLYDHEYMGNVRAAVFEAESTYKAYAAMGILSLKKTFTIPVFKNMPNENVDWREVFPSIEPQITCSSKTQTSAVIQWNAVQNADGYVLFKYNPTAKKYAALKTTTALTYTDSTLKAGSTSYYIVRAYYKNESGAVVYTACSPKLTVITYTQQTQQTQIGYVKVGDCLNVRSGPGTDYEKLVQLPNGQQVAVMSQSGSWYKISVTYGGKSYIGYAASDYIVLGQPPVSDPVVEPQGCPYAEPTATLRNGDSGTDVKWLQWHLVKLGYLSSSTTIDGKFGTNTYNAVVAFQTAKSLEADGIVGSATRTALKNAV